MVVDLLGDVEIEMPCQVAEEVPLEQHQVGQISALDEQNLPQVVYCEVEIHLDEILALANRLLGKVFEHGPLEGISVDEQL